MDAERCDECRFDATRWNDDDVITTTLVIGALWHEYVVGTPEALLQRRVRPDRWSIAEYSWHLADSLDVAARLIRTAYDAPGCDVGDLARPPITPEAEPLDVAAAQDRLRETSRELFDLLRGRPAAAWSDAAVVLRGRQVDVGWLGRHVCHEAMHHLHDVGRLRVALGDGVATQTGTVVQLNVSDGGVPKRPVPELEVGWNGPAGDRQNDRRNHGRPFQALCLWSSEVIAELAGQGHPLRGGSAGENLTLTGLDWAALRPGTELSVGTVRAELSSHAIPCAKNAGWFHDGDFNRIHHERNPGLSRLYATILQPGHIVEGDAIVIEPDQASVSRAPTG